MIKGMTLLHTYTHKKKDWKGSWKEISHSTQQNCGVKNYTTGVNRGTHHAFYTGTVKFAGVSSTPSGVILTPLVVILTLFGVMLKL